MGNNDDPIPEFLRGARDAEALMVAANDPSVRAEWARIAMCYRDLIETAKHTAAVAELSELPASEPNN